LLCISKDTGIRTNDDELKEEGFEGNYTEIGRNPNHFKENNFLALD
jgi:hypothetical protein